MSSPIDPPSNDNLPTRLPRPAVGRLSLYFRELHRLAEQDVTHINSKELGALVDVSPAVVRRDLSSLGTIGTRGIGYEIAKLIAQIGEVLGSGVQWQVILVGVGSLGDALLRYRGFERLGFRLTAAFDLDPQKIGTSIGGVSVSSAETMVGRLRRSTRTSQFSLSLQTRPRPLPPSWSLVASAVSLILPQRHFDFPVEPLSSTLTSRVNCNASPSVFKTASCWKQRCWEQSLGSSQPTAQTERGEETFNRCVCLRCLE